MILKSFYFPDVLVPFNEESISGNKDTSTKYPTIIIMSTIILMINILPGLFLEEFLI